MKKIIAGSDGARCFIGSAGSRGQDRLKTGDLRLSDSWRREPVGFQSSARDTCKYHTRLGGSSAPHFSSCNIPRLWNDSAGTVLAAPLWQQSMQKGFIEPVAVIPSFSISESVQQQIIPPPPLPFKDPRHIPALFFAALYETRSCWFDFIRFPCVDMKRKIRQSFPFLCGHPFVSPAPQLPNKERWHLERSARGGGWHSNCSHLKVNSKRRLMVNAGF